MRLEEERIMASNDLIIDDDYCKAIADRFVQEGEHIDQIAEEYLSILLETRNKAILDGATANALSAYISAASVLRNKTEKISIDFLTEILNFISEVDSEDQYLF